MRTPVPVFTTPMQFGPIMRMPWRRACSTSWRSALAPSGPVSPKPAEITTSPPTRFLAHSSITPETAAAGTTITARSTSSGMSTTDGKARTLATWVAVGCTG